MSVQIVICPGCRLKIETTNSQIDRDFNASASCRELVYQLSYYSLSLRDDYFIHQLVVDTYAAQHSKIAEKPIRLAFALIGLYLVNEKGYTGKEVQLAHMAIGKISKVWPRFTIPKSKDWLTVKQVVESEHNIKEEMIKKWSRSVWEVWAQDKDVITGLLSNIKMETIKVK